MAEPDVWKKCVSQYKSEVTTRDFEQFIRPLRAINTGERLILEAQNEYVTKQVHQRHLQRICELVAQHCDPGHTILEVQVKTSDQVEPLPVSVKQSTEKRSVLKREYTFARFVEGSSNQYSKQVAQEVAKKPASKINPLLIYGSTGLGKTHLMQSIGHYILGRNNQANVCYMSAQTFVTEMVLALTRDNASKRVRRFTKQFHQVDVLLVDDIHLFATKEKCQEEFFHVFNDLIDKENVQIALTSDRYPHEIEGLDTRLRSRFVMGFCTEVKLPDLETRAAILVQVAREQGIKLEPDVALFIATHVKSNVRELIGVLNKVIFDAEYHSYPTITIERVKENLKDLFAVHRRRITIEKIQTTVVEYFHIRLSDILGSSRLQSFVRPRHIAMALAHELTSLPLQAIARHFNRDHTTVMSGIERIRKLRKSDMRVEEDYTSILRKLVN